MLLPNQKWLAREPDGAVRFSGPLPLVLLPGSFNPLHRGHRLLAEVAARKLGQSAAFELSITNVDKAELQPDEVRRRLDQFVGFATVYVTRAKTFEQKATIFPGTVMVVGVDTAERIVDPRYYGDDPARRDRSLRAIRERGCRFLVAGRIGDRPQFVDLEGIEVPDAFRDLFAGISELEFRMDLSSREIRTRWDRR